MLNRSWLRLLVAAALAALAGAGTAHAAAGKIAGTVTDAGTGSALANANVLVMETEAAASTDSEGRFFLLNVSPGIYTLRVTYVGYRPVIIEEVRVSADLTTNLEFRLGGEAIEVEEVVIKAERPIIDKNATNAVRIVEAEDIEILPGRGLGSVINLQPGVVIDEGALHIRGSRSDEVGYFVDGAAARNPVSGGRAVAVIDEALQEIQLQAGGFNAEYGGANAGIILQELRTGAPAWEVDLLTETDGFTSKYKERFGTYSYGYSNQVLTLSGPVAGNRVRAFLAGQRRIQDSVPPTGRASSSMTWWTRETAADGSTGSRTTTATPSPTRWTCGCSRAISTTPARSSSASTAPCSSTCSPSNCASPASTPPRKGEQRRPRVQHAQHGAPLRV